MRKPIILLLLICTLHAVRCPMTNAQQIESDPAALQAELDRIALDREAVLAKFKMIVDENTRLKDEITVLQVGIVNLDNLRKAREDERKVLQDKLTDLRKEFEPIVKLKSEVTGLKSQVRKYEDKIKQLEEEIKAWQKKELNVKNARDEGRKKLEKKEKEFEKEKLALEDKLKTANKKAKDAIDSLADANKDLGRLKKEAADMHYNLGVIFQNETRFDNAIREYKKVLEVKPDDGPTHYNIALIYDTVKNDRAKAIHHYRRYLDIEPDADDAARVKERLAELGVEQGIWGDPGAKGIGDKEKLGRW